MIAGKAQSANASTAFIHGSKEFSVSVLGFGTRQWSFPDFFFTRCTSEEEEEVVERRCD